MAATLTRHELSTDLIPAPVECAVLSPDPELLDGATPDGLVIALHGGAGGGGFPEEMATLFDAAWRQGSIRPCTVAVPESGRSFWIDRADGSERWESFLRDELGPAIAALDRGWSGHGPVALLGVSMGGLGALRLAFHQPEAFVGVAALEPGVEAAADWSEVDPASIRVRSIELFESLHGSPVDPAHFDANHPPALIAARHAELAASGLQIYIECGDEDMLRLHHGAELMHRLLWDLDVPHEYHLVRGADHVGRTMPARFAEAVGFLGRAFDPPGPDPFADAVRAILAPPDDEPT